MISIVTSTYARFGHVTKLVQSVRTAFPAGAYEIVAVTSDPHDSEKVKWLLAQSDITTIQADERKPGTPILKSLYAYENMGLRACTGEWVIVVNDDMEIGAGFYPTFTALADNFDVFVIKSHLAEVGYGPRTAVIGHITPPGGPQRPLYLYDVTAIRLSVYKQIGYLDEKLAWFGKGFDLAMACETVPGIRVCATSDLLINHSITAENRMPPGCGGDFAYMIKKWREKCSQTGWDFYCPC